MREPTFAQQLRAYKNELAVTDEELAFILGVPRRTLNAWQSGNTAPWLIAREGAIAKLQGIVDRRPPVEVIMPKVKWAQPTRK
jgi:DNA-binding XRE family transcriptional regulator